MAFVYNHFGRTLMFIVLGVLVVTLPTGQKLQIAAVLVPYGSYFYLQSFRGQFLEVQYNNNSLLSFDRTL